MAAALPDLSRPGLLDFFRGFALPFRALGMLFATPRLVKLTLAVAAVTLASLIGLAIGLWHAVPALVGALWRAPDSGVLVVLHGALTVLVFGVLFVVGANVLPMTLAAPLIDPISVETERCLGIAVRDEGGLGRMVREVVQALANALVRLLVLGIGHALLLLLLLIPVAGGPLWTGLGWAWTSLWVAAQHLDVPMARHLYSFDHEIHVLRTRFPLCLGFGAAVGLMLWVPLLNSFFVPVAVIAATLLFRGLVASGGVPPPGRVPRLDPHA